MNLVRDTAGFLLVARDQAAPTEITFLAEMPFEAYVRIRRFPSVDRVER